MNDDLDVSTSRLPWTVSLDDWEMVPMTTWKATVQDTPGDVCEDVDDRRARFVPVRPFHAALLVEHGPHDAPPAADGDDQVLHQQAVTRWKSAWDSAHWVRKDMGGSNVTVQEDHPWMGHVGIRRARMASMRFRRESAILASLLRLKIPVMLWRLLPGGPQEIAIIGMGGPVLEHVSAHHLWETTRRQCGGLLLGRDFSCFSFMGDTPSRNDLGGDRHAFGVDVQVEQGDRLSSMSATLEDMPWALDSAVRSLPVNAPELSWRDRLGSYRSVMVDQDGGWPVTQGCNTTHGRTLAMLEAGGAALLEGSGRTASGHRHAVVAWKGGKGTLHSRLVVRDVALVHGDVPEWVMDYVPGAPGFPITGVYVETLRRGVDGNVSRYSVDSLYDVDLPNDVLDIALKRLGDTFVASLESRDIPGCDGGAATDAMLPRTLTWKVQASLSMTDADGLAPILPSVILLARHGLHPLMVDPTRSGLEGQMALAFQWATAMGELGSDDTTQRPVHDKESSVRRGVFPVSPGSGARNLWLSKASEAQVPVRGRFEHMHEDAAFLVAALRHGGSVSMKGNGKEFLQREIGEGASLHGPVVDMSWREYRSAGYYPSKESCTLSRHYWLNEGFMRVAGRDIVPCDGYDMPHVLAAMAKDGHPRAFVKAKETKLGVWVVELPPGGDADAMVLAAYGVMGHWMFEAMREGFLVQEFVPFHDEMRFFVVDHRVVDAVPVRRRDTIHDRMGNGRLDPRTCRAHDGADAVVDRARVARYGWKSLEVIRAIRETADPEARDYVLDLGSDGEGNVLPIEINSLARAGLYAASPDRIMGALCRAASRRFASLHTRRET